MAAKSSAKEILLLTGISGAGKSTALKTLEDLGFTVIDNMPLRLVPALLADRENLPDRLALEVDIRTQDIASHFDVALKAIKAVKDVQTHVVFLNAEDDVILRRYKETRRRHPLHDGRPVLEVVALERQVLSPVKEVADAILDTSSFKPADLRRYLESQFGASARMESMAVFIMSFGFKHGLPKEADLVFDMRFLRNPHYEPDLKPKTGHNPEIKAYISEDENLTPALENMTGLLNHQLPLFEKEGKAYLTIAIGCTGGKHRSVMVSEEIAGRLSGLPYKIKTYHRDIENVAG